MANPILYPIPKEIAEQIEIARNNFAKAQGVTIRSIPKAKFIELRMKGKLNLILNGK